MRRLLLPMLLCAGLGGRAQAGPPPRALPPVYAPDPSKWRLELTPDLGGWLTAGRRDIHIKLVDPGDPDPPREEAEGFEESEEWDGGEAGEPPERTAEELRQERLWAEESARRNAWRERRLFVWFNGTHTQLAVQVGRSCDDYLESRNGENRLEILEPDSGQRIIRSWWSSASRARLIVAQVHAPDEGWTGGDLEVLEPNGDLAVRGRRTPSGGALDWSNEYRHAAPSLGTYTLRWTGGYRGENPVRIVVEAVLDGGTDSERRWRFERLVLPGAGPVILGTLDVED